MTSELQDGQLTVAELLDKLNAMVAANPAILTCGVFTVEFGGITPTSLVEFENDSLVLS
jgi:hypothetical protein